MICSPQSIKSLFYPGVLKVAFNYQGMIEEKLFSLSSKNVVLSNIFIEIILVPIESYNIGKVHQILPVCI